eukprot:6035363-Pyramimonas_sp.AAC.2
MRRMWVHIAKIYVRRTRAVLGGCLLTITLIIACVAIFTPDTTMDTGTQFFHTRGTKIAKQSLATTLAKKQLVALPNAELNQHIKLHNWMDTSLDGRLLGRKEMHVLLRAHNTEHMSHNILDPAHLRLVCNVKKQLLSSPYYPSVCALKDETTSVGNGTSHCSADFNILDMYQAHEVVKMAPLLDAVTLGVREYSAEFVAKRVPHLCAMADAGSQMCDYARGSWCDHDKCNVPNNSSRRCVKIGINVCEWIAAVQPTASEVQAIADMPRMAADARGCDNIDMRVMELSLRAGFAMHGWIQRGAAIRGLQIPFDLLVDRWFHETMAASGQTRMESNVTRISVVLQVRFILICSGVLSACVASAHLEDM